MKVRVFLAVFCSAFFAIPWYFIFENNMKHPFVLSVAIGGLFASVLLVYFIIHKRYTEYRFRKAEDHITSEVFLKANGNFNLGRTEKALGSHLKNCNIYFCEDEVIFVTIETRPFTLERLSTSDILNVSSDSVSHISISTTDGRIYFITTPDAKRISSVLAEKSEWLNK